MSHSPGPWEYHPKDEGWTVGTAGPDGWVIATLVVYSTDEELMTDDVQHANGRLIAAAPDLLASLKLITTWQERSNIMTRCGGAVGEIIRRCNEAIAKAEARP